MICFCDVKICRAHYAWTHINTSSSLTWSEYDGCSKYTKVHFYSPAYVAMRTTVLINLVKSPWMYGAYFWKILGSAGPPQIPQTGALILQGRLPNFFFQCIRCTCSLCNRDLTGNRVFPLSNEISHILPVRHIYNFSIQDLRYPSDLSYLFKRSFGGQFVTFSTLFLGTFLLGSRANFICVTDFAKKNL